MGQTTNLDGFGLLSFLDSLEIRLHFTSIGEMMLMISYPSLCLLSFDFDLSAQPWLYFYGYQQILF